MFLVFGGGGKLVVALPWQGNNKSEGPSVNNLRLLTEGWVLSLSLVREREREGPRARGFVKKGPRGQLALSF